MKSYSSALKGGNANLQIFRKYRFNICSKFNFRSKMSEFHSDIGHLKLIV